MGLMTDDNLLRVNAVGALGWGAIGMAAPGKMHELLYTGSENRPM